MVAQMLPNMLVQWMCTTSDDNVRASVGYLQECGIWGKMLDTAAANTDDVADAGAMYGHPPAAAL